MRGRDGGFQGSRGLVRVVCDGTLLIVILHAAECDGGFGANASELAAALAGTVTSQADGELLRSLAGRQEA